MSLHYSWRPVTSQNSVWLSHDTGLLVNQGPLQWFHGHGPWQLDTQNKQTYKEARNRDRVSALLQKIATTKKRPLGCTYRTEAYRLRTSGVIHTGQHCPSSVQPCRSFEAMSELWPLFFDTSSDVTLLSLPSSIETAESPLASTQSSMTTYVLAPRSKVQILSCKKNCSLHQTLKPAVNQLEWNSSPKYHLTCIFFDMSTFGTIKISIVLTVT
jgi:hypothetical protein